MIGLSVPEVRKRLLKLAWSVLPSAEKVLAWSEWRRTHHYRARTCHYQKRGARVPDG